MSKLCRQQIAAKSLTLFAKVRSITGASKGDRLDAGNARASRSYNWEIFSLFFVKLFPTSAVNN